MLGDGNATIRYLETAWITRDRSITACECSVLEIDQSLIYVCSTVRAPSVCICPTLPTYIVSMALTSCSSRRIHHHPHPLGELSNLGIHLLVDGPVRHSGDALLAGDFVDAWGKNIYIISLYLLFS